MMISSFQQLEAPETYYNSNGVSFGYVVRVRGLDRSLYLNDIGKIQDELMAQTPAATPAGTPAGGSNRLFYMTTAIFKSEHHAYAAAERFYESHGWEYDYELTAAGWRTRPDNLNAKNCVKTVESQVMEFA